MTDIRQWLEGLGLGQFVAAFEAEPVRAWRVGGLSQAESQFEAAYGAQLTAFVGRDAELALLLEKWAQAKEGEGQVVLLAGEPGIGKAGSCGSCVPASRANRTRGCATSARPITPARRCIL